MRPSPQKPYSGIFVINQYEELKKEENLDVQLFAMKRTFTSTFGSLLKYIRAFFQFVPFYYKKYDILHLHYFFPFIIMACVYKFLHPSTKVVVTFHGSDINERINNYNKRFFKLFTKCIDFTIAVGKDLSTLIHEKLHLKSNIILSAGVDERKFKFIENVKKKYHFTFAASFIPRKGLDIYLKAIEQLNNRNLRFCFIGSGILEKDIRELSRKFPVEIKLNLTQEEMCEVFNQSYFHVLPSRFEPFGLVVTESMFCGVPSIVSKIGGMKDQVIDNVNGFFIDEPTPQNIIKTLEKGLKTIEDKTYYTMQSTCLKSNKEYCLSNVINQTRSIYHNLVNNKLTDTKNSSII